MEIKLYLNLLIKRIWIVILLPLVAGSIAAYISYYKTQPVYSSSTTLLAINSQTDNSNVTVNINDVLLDQQLVKEYKEIITSRAVTSTVVKELNLPDISANQLAGSISVSLKEETRILKISVMYHTAEGAKLLTDKVSEVFIRKALELVKADNIVVIDKAEVPGGPIGPSHKKNITLAVLGGLILSFIIIFILEELDDSIKTVEDVENELGLKVLSTVPMLKLKAK